MLEINTNPDSEYDKHVRNKHEQWNTPESVLFDEISSVSGLTPIKRDRIIKGENSEVYKIKTLEGKSLIARISHSENPRFERERWAINQAKSMGVLTPDVLAVKAVSTEFGTITISIESELAGVPLEEIPEITNNSSENLLKDLMKQAGGELAKIHSVKTNGFGPLDGEGKGQWRSLEEVWLEMEPWREKIEEIASSANIKKETLVSALNILKNSRN